MKHLTPIQKNFTDVCGFPLDGGKVAVFLHGTTDYAILYSNSEGNAFSKNPFTLDVLGSLNFFVDPEVSLDYFVYSSDGILVKSFIGVKVASCEVETFA